MKENTFRKEYPPKTCLICGSLFYRPKMVVATNWKKKLTCSKECFGKLFTLNAQKGMLKVFGKMVCKLCGIEFEPKNQNHFYCGSKSHKWGCSFKHYLEAKKIANARYRMGKGRRYGIFKGHTTIVK